VLRALEQQGASPRVLVTTADHALLDAEMIDYVLRAAEEERDADLLVAMAKREIVEAAWPDMRRTWMTFGPDSVTACNLFALKTHQARNAVRFWRDMEKHRKKPWKIALAFGLIPLLRIMLGRAGLRAAFAEASRRLNVMARPVLMPMPEAALDVDKPSDYELVQRIVKARSASGQ
jgi:GTP:adenosylcobinamide-phosphate guanylyltransferase